MTSLGTTSLLHNATYLQNAFITTFLTSLGLETVRYILGESVIYQKKYLVSTINIFPMYYNYMCFRARHQIQSREWSDVRLSYWWERRVLVELRDSESWRSVKTRTILSTYLRPLLPEWLLHCWPLPHRPTRWLCLCWRDLPRQLVRCSSSRCVPSVKSVLRNV